jgi:hypothetical protein
LRRTVTFYGLLADEAGSLASSMVQVAECVHEAQARFEEGAARARRCRRLAEPREGGPRAARSA